MGICLAVTSGKGGTGKSTVSAGLAVALSKSGKSVLLIDADEGLRCLDLVLGVDRDIVFDLGDVLSGRELSDAVYKAPLFKGVELIPAPGNPGCIKAAAFSELIKRVVREYDAVIIDFPAGLDFSLYSALGRKTQFITVCNPDPISVRDAQAVSMMLPETAIPPRLIINKFNIELIKSGVYKNIDDIIDTSGIRLLGIVPQSLELQLLPVNHKLKKGGNALSSFIRIALRICGKDVGLPALKKI